MPHNGEINTQFGIYKNLCCGTETMVREGAVFPDCKNHPKLTTIWKQVDLDKPSKDPLFKNDRRSA